MGNSIRQPGFYWVRLRGSPIWIVAQYLKKDWPSSWLIPGTGIWYADINFEKIGRKIKEPVNA